MLEALCELLFCGLFDVIAGAAFGSPPSTRTPKPPPTDHWLITSTMTALVAATLALIIATFAGATLHGAAVVAFATAILTLLPTAYLTRPRRRPTTSPSARPR